MKKTHCIITIHNKEDLIENVLSGIINSTINDKHEINIICVLDGCIDATEKNIDKFEKTLTSNYKLYKVYQNDVHELLSINAGIEFINKNLNPTEDDLIFFLQDDVILDHIDMISDVETLYSRESMIGYISFRCGLFTDLDASGVLYEHSFFESSYGHWKQLNLKHFTEFERNDFTICEIVIKSPTCIKKKILDIVGQFDEKLAPFGHDDLDLCIRLNVMGYRNAILGIKFESKLDWGGTREKKNSTKDYHTNYDYIVRRNKLYLSSKHREYYLNKHNVKLL